MRILYHHRTLGDGAEGIHVSSMIEAFRSLGHEVLVSSLIGDATNVSTVRTRLLTRVRRLLPQAAYETMELSYNIVGRRALSAGIARWKPDLIYERHTLFNFAGVSAAERAGVPLVLEINAPLAYERLAYERLTFKRLARRAERDVCSRAAVVVAVSTPLKEYLMREGVPADRIIVVPNGADPAVFKPNAQARAEVRAQYGIPADAVVVGFTGILRPWHGVDILVHALERLAHGAGGDRTHLLIVGDGPSRADIERTAAVAGLQNRVTITGRVPHDRIPSCVAAFDIAVSPRATFYASPMKVPEYMAAGAAVVAPDMANLTDLVTHDVSALLFAPGDVGALAEALHTLITDRQRRQALSRAARAAIVEGRTWRHNAAIVLKGVEQVRACA